MNWFFYFFSFVFIVVGVLHLLKPKAFMRVMPLYLPFHKTLVYISGIAEISAGVGILFSETRVYALWGMFIMLVLFIPVHIHMLVNKNAGLNLPKSILVIRLLLQFFFIYWVYQYIP